MIEAIQQLLAEQAGLDIEVLGPHALERALAARMASCSISEPGAYLRLLYGSKGELNNLVEELAVLETWFFRDAGPFDFLQEYAKGRHGVRALSAACATGEEAYSIAIALLEAGLYPGSCCVDACDISQRALQAASRAVYPAASFREEWHDHRNRWFEPVADGFALRPEVTRLVRFHRDDLLHPIFLAAQPPYDVVFCRNVLIYFRPEAQDSVIRLIGRLVAQDGIVITGHAEVNILLRHGYAAAGEPRCFACRKITPTTTPEPVQTAPRSAVVEAPAPTSAASCPAPEPLTERGQLLLRARQLADEGAFEDAWSSCEGVLAQRSDPDAYYLEGVISAARSQLDVAEECFRKALYLDPGHYLSLVQMSLLCQRQGETARSKLFRDRAAKLAKPAEVIDAQRR